MGARRFALVLVLGVSPLQVVADDHRLTVPAIPSVMQECTACHIAYPPTLLLAEDWHRVMATLDRHYGVNATLDEKTRREIDTWLAANAGSPAKVGVGGTATPRGSSPRLTATPWFERKHREVRSTDWKSAKLKSPANCGGCHTRAVDGSYRESEIRMPDGRRWED